MSRATGAGARGRAASGPLTAGDRVCFGMHATLRLPSGAAQAFRLGREAGDSVAFQGVEAEIVSIEP